VKPSTNKICFKKKKTLYKRISTEIPWKMHNSQGKSLS
jgi:hypothetical protein